MIIKLLSKAFLGVFVASGIAFAQYDPNSADKIALSQEVKTGVLKNGMTYFIKKNSNPEKRAHLKIAIKAGAIQEDDDQNGLAHFTEHMCFNGTKRYPKNEIFNVLNKYGIKFGAGLNGGTYMDFTIYDLIISLDDENLLNESFNILEEWSHNLSFEDTQIDGERDIIISEWRQGNNAQERLMEQHRNDIYFGSKYAKRNCIGDTSLLRHFKYDVLKRYYHDWYRPDLMAVIAVGDFDVNKIEEMIKKQFSEIKNPNNERPRNIFKIPYHKDMKVSIAKDPEQTSELITIYKKLPHIDINSYQGFAETLKRQTYDIIFNERLRDKIQNPESPFLSLSAGETNYYGDSRLYVSTISAKPNLLKQALGEYYMEMNRVKSFGFTASELERAKKVLYSYLDNLKQSEKTRENKSYAEEIAFYFLDQNSMGGMDFDYKYSKQIIDQLTLTELNRLASLYSASDNTVIAVDLPDNTSTKEISKSEILNVYNSAQTQKLEAVTESKIDKPLFNKKINPGKILSSTKNKVIDAEILKLSNGAKVILKPTKFKEDDINLYAYSMGGNSLYKEKDRINAQLSAQLAGEGGLGEFNQSDLQKALSGVNVKLETFTNDYMESLNASSNNKDLEIMFQLANLKLGAPRSDKKAFEAWISKVKPALERKGENSDAAFADSVNWIQANHNSLAKPIDASDLNNINYERALEIYKERFENAGDFTYILVGDFDPAIAKKYFEKYIASINVGKTEKYKDLGIRFPKNSVKSEFQKGKEDKAHLRLTLHGEFKNTQENRIILKGLSDALVLKMLETVREKLSGAYSPMIWSSASKIPYEHYTINIDLVISPKRAQEMINACVGVINDMKQTSDDECIFKVKQSQLKDIEVNIKDNDYWISWLSQYSQYGENLSSILDSKKYIEKLDAKTLQNAAKKYLNTDAIIQILEMPEKM
jgi:zinc protease